MKTHESMYPGNTFSVNSSIPSAAGDFNMNESRFTQYSLHKALKASWV